MGTKTLLVRARGAACVPDYDRLAANPRHFIGRQWGTVDGRPALIPTDAAEEVPARHEYVRAVQEGSLWAADKATADACGVPFDALFGAPPPAPATDSHGDASAEKAEAQ